MECKGLQKKTDCCFEYIFKKSIIFAKSFERIMSYELAEIETTTTKGINKTLSRKELNEKCYSLEESKRLLLKKVHHHYHPES